MSDARYVLLGLAHPRSEWVRKLSQWCNGGAVPAELLKCLSCDDVVHRLDSGRPASAVIVDAGTPGIDRDLLNTARVAGCAVLVVDDSRIAKDWVSLGASAVLSSAFTRAQLLDSLATHATLIDRASETPAAPVSVSSSPLKGRVIVVTGTGGTGASTVAIAAAQGLASSGQRVLLADLKLNAEQAMLHDVTRPSGGLLALVEAHRLGGVDPGQLHDLCLAVPNRGYDLLPGLHRARFWSSVRPVTFTAAFATLTNAYDVVVCDVDADVEREETGGSLDVEERTSMSRIALNEAAVVLTVGQPSMKGLHSLNRLLIELGDLGIDVQRVVPVFNQAARSPRVRSGYTAALAELIEWRNGIQPLSTPAHLPSREVDELLRSGAPLPDALTAPLVAAATALMKGQSAGTSVDRSPRFARIRPGALRSFTQEAS